MFLKLVYFIKYFHSFLMKYRFPKQISCIIFHGDSVLLIMSLKLVQLDLLHD